MSKKVEKTEKQLQDERRLKELKKQYGDVFFLKFENEEEDGEEYKRCFLKSMDRPTLAAAKSVAMTDTIRMSEIVIENCWIEGDEEIKTDDRYFFGAMDLLQELINKKQAILTKY